MLKILLCTLILAVPAYAGDDGSPRVMQAEGARLEWVDGSLILDVEHDETPQQIRISRDGELTIGERAIATERSDRKLLRKFVNESARLADLVDQVAACVREQIDPATDPADQEKLAKRLLDLGQKAEKQNGKVAEVAMKLADRLPELGSLLAVLGE